MNTTVRLLLASQAALFLAASGVHLGVLLTGWEHRKAATAEGVIGVVLLAGLALTWSSLPGVPVALAVQGFALLGTLVGLLTIALGIGPRTGPDLVLHAIMLLLLGTGLAVTWHVA